MRNSPLFSHDMCHHPWLLLIFCWCFSLSISAQSVISGRVSDEKAQPMQGVMVRAYDAGHKMVLGFTTTNAQGRYHLPTKAEWGDEIIVRWQTLAYKLVEEKVKNQSQERNVTLHPSEVTFKTVEVRAPIMQRHGDTITYNVDRLRARGQTNLEQVIKNIPGVTVDASGTIKYNGESINYFYIEGMNLLDQNYNLATRNIRPEDVNTISVLENHQPIEVLKGVQWSKRASFNITLKKRAHLRPIGFALAGGGLGDDATKNAQGELFMLLLRKRSQTLLSAKANNWASDYRGEARTAQGNPHSTIADRVFADFPFGTAPVAETRYQDATYAFASVHHLRALAPKNTLKFVGSYAYKNAAFTLDRQTRYQREQQTPLAVDENIHQQRWVHQGAIKLDWEKNLPTSYLHEVLTANFSQQSAEAALPLQVVAQNQQRLTYNVDNLLVWKQRSGQQVRTWTWKMQWTNVPKLEFWTTTPLQNPQQVGSTERYTQSLTTQSGNFFAQTGWAWVLGDHSQYGVVGLEAKAKGEFEELSLLSSTLAPQAGAMPATFQHWGGDFSAMPYYDWHESGYGFKVLFPLTYRLHSFTPSHHRTKQTLNRLYCTPELRLSSKLSRSFIAEASTSYDISLGGLEDIVDVPLYLTYRQRQSLGSGQIAFARSWSNSLALFQLPNALGHTISGALSYVRSEHDQLSSSEISASGQEQSGYAAARSVLHQWMGNFRHAYHKLEWHARFGWSVSYNGVQSQLLRSAVVQPITHHRAKISLESAVYLWQSALQIEGNVSLSRQWSMLPSQVRIFTSPAAQVRVAFHPRNHWEVYASVDAQRNPLADGRYVTAWFVDGGARYVWQKWELLLTLRNLANQKTYAEQQFVGADIFTKATHLRPLEGMLSIKRQF